jgi:ABC-2 type transport system permease protein
MRTLKKHLKIMLCYFRLNLASALEYRASFLSQAFGMALSNSSFIFFWWVGFHQLGGTIGGYSFEDVLFIWAVGSASFGLSSILFANVGSLSQLIITGELDTFLLQPCNALLSMACARTSLSAYGDLLYGVVLMAAVFHSSAIAWLWFIFALLLGALLIAAISLAANTLGFYLGDVSQVSRMATEFTVSFSIYPESIYGPAVRALMYSLIPISFVVHVPLRLLHEFHPAPALLSLAGVLLYCALAGWFFYRGLRRYESGNVIVTRM